MILLVLKCCLFQEKNAIKHLHSSCLSTKLCLMDSKYSIDFIFTDKEKSVCSIKSFSISRLNFRSWVIISGILQHSKAMTIYWCSLTTVLSCPIAHGCPGPTSHCWTVYLESESLYNLELSLCSKLTLCHCDMNITLPSRCHSLSQECQLTTVSTHVSTMAPSHHHCKSFLGSITQNMLI